LQRVRGSFAQAAPESERVLDPVSSRALLEQVALDRLLHDSREPLLTSLGSELKQLRPVLIAEFDRGAHCLSIPHMHVHVNRPRPAPRLFAPCSLSTEAGQVNAAFTSGFRSIVSPQMLTGRLRKQQGMKQGIIANTQTARASRQSLSARMVTVQG
jgi:hypothetical protein